MFNLVDFGKRRIPSALFHDLAGFEALHAVTHLANKADLP